MPLGGKLVLKGGATLKELQGVEKKKGKKVKKKEEGGEEVDGGLHEAPPLDPTKPKPVAATAVNVMSGKTYEEEFDLETKRVKEGKARSTPWGCGYRAPPAILHGYTAKVTGKTAEERLDLRAASKSDKFCK
ncbi:hypothetical protein VOLCADRAFT_104372 [Volvox carteri f. nagariensis]|uniref:Uncharacterized protein n=1 Tax=Volvox carteri f. nagariensis TaxID=3068 RepID=D8TTB6_VOLCA|nr:uncharacterized protein VOLCADRAFT_104372 [Volvox carteri f. nagariensis]EFJ49172.1 hypothetical protein VOLCADRAFT_104372 [Volvox carteri f. nagariensis]|eukprot:XP_002949620.1 hypothetical protein VOLCADRAFT_104372 [Volvox carteri f. nagariensis]